MSDAVVGLDAALRVTCWNRGAERLYSIPGPAALGRTFTDLVTCRPPAPPLDTPQQLPNSIGLADGPATHATATGRAVPVRVTLIPFRHAQDGGGYLAVIRDDTAHVQLAALLEERLQFETLLSELAARFSSIDEDHVDAEIDHWLRRLVEALNVDRSTFAQILPDGTISVTHSYAGPAIAPYPRGTVNSALPWLVREFAERRVVVLSRIPEDVPEHAVEERRYFTSVGMKSGVGIPVAIGGDLVCVLTLGTFREAREWPKDLISRLHLAGNAFANAVARRQAKQRLDTKRQELAHVGRLAVLAELASVIAHELDQPLTAVVSNAEAVRYLLHGEEANLAEADEALKDVIDSAMRISEIITRERRLLSKSMMRVEPVDLNEAVREIELFIRAEARRDAARVAFELLPGLPPIKGDRVQLQQVILNLARNGLQAVRSQPRTSRELVIRTASTSGEVTLTVSDTGPPVDDASFGRMFEAFYTTKENGLGMGLAISKSILETHRGRIWATRNAERGLTVHVAIPRK